MNDDLHLDEEPTDPADLLYVYRPAFTAVRQHLARYPRHYGALGLFAVAMVLIPSVADNATGDLGPTGSAEQISTFATESPEPISTTEPGTASTPDEVPVAPSAPVVTTGPALGGFEDDATAQPAPPPPITDAEPPASAPPPPRPTPEPEPDDGPESPPDDGEAPPDQEEPGALPLPDLPVPPGS